MPKKAILLIFLIFSGSISLWGQCSPDRDSIYKQLIQYDVNSGASSFNEKLAELNGKLEKMNNCPYKNDSTHALLLQIIGDVYSTRRDFINQVKYYKQSIDIMRANANNPAINLKKLMKCYYWVSDFFDSLNNVSETMKAVNNCIDIALKLRSSSDMEYIRVLFKRVKYSFDIGDYHQCMEDAIMCEKLAREYIKTAPKGSRDYYAGEGFVLSSVGWYVNAQLRLKNYIQAEEFLINKPDEYKKAGLGKYLAQLYSQLANVQLHKGENRKALISYKSALLFARQSGDDFTCIQILNTTGSDFYLNYLNDADNALYYFRKALSYCNKSKLRERKEMMESLSIFTNIGNVYVLKGSFDSAFIYFQRAFDQIRPGMNENDISKISLNDISQYPKLYYLVSLLTDKAGAFQKKYLASRQLINIGKAINIYKAADQLLDRMRQVQSDMESKLFWRSNSHSLYEQAIDACYLQGDKEAAFYFFEKDRAALLHDQLKQQQWTGAEDFSKLTQVKIKIAGLENSLVNITGSSDKTTAINAELFTNKQEYANLEEQIKKRYPLYSQSIDTFYMRLTDVQTGLLKDQQAMIEIFSGDSAVYTLLITNGKTYFTKINKEAFEKTTASYISYLSNRDLLAGDFTGFRNVSNRLYQLIFNNNTVPQGGIIISPAEYYFPFESLVTDNSLKNPVYFLDAHAVSYTYSARYLANNFASNTTVSSADFLGIAPVQYPSGFHLAPLSNSDQSLEKIESYISDSHNLVTKNASKNNFLTQFPDYKIIQLYTHSSYSSDKREPVIYFADSSLNLSALITEKIPVTQLVVLSACETGNGKLYQGEGVFSFNRGFAALGIPSSISNLWSVDNLSAYQLTEYFYKYLSEGLPLDVSLQKAKLEFLTTASGENKLPYYWAPAILIGKTNPIIQNNKSVPWKSFLLLTLFTGVIIGGLRKYIKRMDELRVSA